MSKVISSQIKLLYHIGSQTNTLPSSLCIVSTSESSAKSDTGSGGESPTSLEKKKKQLLNEKLHRREITLTFLRIKYSHRITHKYKNNAKKKDFNRNS